MAIAGSEALASLGFTGLESEVYAFLLTESPATGYRIAHGIGKQVANVYKAIQSLADAGVILIEGEGSRQCSPVPVEDLIGRIASDFEHRRQGAQAALLALQTKKETDHRLFPINDSENALHQARLLISEATWHIAIKINPTLKSALAGDLEAAEAKRVRIIEQAFQSGIALAVDGKSALVADIRENDAEGFWTRSVFQALLIHDGIVTAAALQEIHTELEDGAGAKRIARVLSSVESADRTLGAKETKDPL